MTRHSMEPGTRKHVKGYGFLSFRVDLSNKYGKQLLDAATKTRLDALNTTCKKLVHKSTGEFIGNKIADEVVKSNLVFDENLRNVEEIIISPEKREKMLN